MDDAAATGRENAFTECAAPGTAFFRNYDPPLSESCLARLGLDAAEKSTTDRLQQQMHLPFSTNHKENIKRNSPLT